MGGVDRFNQRKERYQIRRSAKWRHRIFYFLIDLAIIYSFISRRVNKRDRSLDQLTFRIALAGQLIDAYFSRKRKGRPASFQAKKRDVSLASLGKHMPKIVSNYRPLAWTKVASSGIGHYNQLLAYADDIDIIGRSEKAVKETFQALEISATNMGLTINEDKTKFMETMPSSVNNTSFCVNGHSFERVSEFKYLGTIINDQNKLKAEINNRIKSANKCFFGLKKQLISKFISGKTKLRLYKTLILPVLLYASETWTLNLETVRALETFERKTLRTIFGPVKDQGCWRTRYNFELYRLYKEPQVTQVIRSNRLRWLGHIWRTPENNQTRAYTFKNPMGSRTRGRPPTRWIDDIENDLKTLNIKNWKRVAAYRWIWRKRAVEAAKTYNRLLRL
ncbi:reverse transcriptase domain-containing protein [Trichonephila clavipes]|nr:reverse transcriptase domain-containing protein [Trichonephila clavipes]